MKHLFPSERSGPGVKILWADAKIILAGKNIIWAGTRIILAGTKKNFQRQVQKYVWQVGKLI